MEISELEKEASKIGVHEHRIIATLLLEILRELRKEKSFWQKIFGQGKAKPR